MEAVHLGDFGKTYVLAVSSTAATFTPTAPASKFMVVADRAVHLSRAGDATTDDVKLAADERANVNVRAHNAETLSFILADGETDGSIRITEIV